MKYNFDEIIDRRRTNSLNCEGFRQYMFSSEPGIKLPYPDEEMIRMWVADMDFATPPEIVKAIEERLTKKIFGYTKVFDPEYYEIFSAWSNKNYDWSFPKEQLFSSPGVIPALYELVEFICHPGDKVLILTPSYAYFKYATEHNHLELVCSDLIYTNGDFEMDFADLEEKAGDEKVKLCIFCNPHNPTGRIWTEEELRRFGKICLDNDLWIVSDEIHCDLLRSGKNHLPLAKFFPESEKIVTCMAPSKTFNMAGLHFSNIIIPSAELREIWNKRHLSFDNPLSIAAAKGAYSSCEEWLRQLRVYLDDNFSFVKSFLETKMPKTRFRIPEATYLAWIDVSAYLPEEKNLPRYFAQEAGVLLEGSDMFVQNGDGFIRLNLAIPRSLLKEGLERIAKACVK